MDEHAIWVNKVDEVRAAHLAFTQRTVHGHPPGAFPRKDGATGTDPRATLDAVVVVPAPKLMEGLEPGAGVEPATY